MSIQRKYFDSPNQDSQYGWTLNNENLRNNESVKITMPVT